MQIGGKVNRDADYEYSEAQDLRTKFQGIR